MAIDPRFYSKVATPSLEEVAALTGSTLKGESSSRATGIAAAHLAGQGDLCFFEGALKDANVGAQALGCFVRSGSETAVPDGVAALVNAFPRRAHAIAASAMFAQKRWSDEGDGPPPSIAEGCRIAPTAVICSGAAIGAGTEIGPNTVVGPGVQIGKACRIGANVAIQCALIGNEVVIHSGAAIGESGFGVMPGPDGLEDAPQFGRVIIQDFVSIGANSCIDRGAFDDTVLGERTKIDNLCQVAHNVVAGRNVVMASFAGISGSVRIGDGVMLGGRVGIADHVAVGSGAQLAASSGVFRDVPDGETWGGTPAKPLRLWMKEVAWLNKQVGGGRKGK